MKYLDIIGLIYLFFKPKAYLSFSNIKYNLNTDEVILLQSLLTQDYFDDLSVLEKNKYTNNNSYYSTQPINSQYYSSEIELNKEMVEEEKDTQNCDIPKKHIITNKNKWKKTLPEGSIELEFTNNPPSCSFDLIITLIKQSEQKKNLNIDNLKEILIEEYLKLSEEYENNILQILNSQGKKKFTNQILKGETSLENVIMSSDYYATNLDIWILAVKFNIPLILFSATKLLENNKSLLVAHSDNTRKFYFVKSPGVRVDNIPKYKLIVLPNNETKISIDLLSIDLQTEINNNVRSNILTEFISEFKLTKKPAIKKLKLVE